MSQPLSDVVLAHYGVKGMKWGRRKARSDTSEAPKRMTRRENRKLNKEARAKFDADRAHNMVKTALDKGDKVLLQVMTPGATMPTIVSGKEFVDYMSRGGTFNVRTSTIYAERDDAGGSFVLKDQSDQKYQKIKR